jgi:CRP-like cAMP-binding protein
MNQAPSHTPTGNSLLDALPQDDFDRIQPSLKRLTLSVRQSLSTQGESLEYVYFPITALISCRATGLQGELIEIYSVGQEGIAEPAAILTGVAAVTAEVQIAGEAYRILIEDLCGLLRQTKELSSVLLKYAYSLAVRMVQATKCAMFHTVEQRLVLWLLMAQSSHGKEIPCTHQAIAEALGSRRASVTIELTSLEQKGIIDRHRGRITIRDRRALEGASCDCFHFIRAGLEPSLECDLKSP